MLRKSGQARGRDSWCWPLGTRMALLLKRINFCLYYALDDNKGRREGGKSPISNTNVNNKHVSTLLCLFFIFNIF